MTRAEWQALHGIDDLGMTRINLGLATFHVEPSRKAKIAKVFDTRIEGRWGDGKKPVVLTPALI